MESKSGGERPIIGHHAGWGLFQSRVPIVPLKLSPGATEAFQLRAREKIDIFGVGLDVVQMDGLFLVRRYHPEQNGGRMSLEKMDWREAEIKAEFRSLELYGESQLFGTVRVRLNPNQKTEAIVSPSKNGTLAKSCNAKVFPEIELPELGLVLNTGEEAVQLASKVVQVPPVGDVARSENSVPLMDQEGEVVGELVSADIEIGEVLHAIPLGSLEKR